MSADSTRSDEAITTGKSGRLPPGMILTIAFGAVLQALNASTMAVALVDIGNHFQAGASASWLVSGLYLATAVGSPTAGRLADMYGPRRIFLGCLVVTTIASAAAPFAPTLGWLIATRVLLGLGTCAAFPAGVALLRGEADRRGITLPTGALSTLAISGQVMIAFGPVLGGALVQVWSWQAIFWINLPLVAAVGALAIVWLPHDVASESTGLRHALRRLDLPGVLLFAATVMALMLLLISLAEQPQWWLLAPTLLFGIGFVLFERRASEPFVNVRTLATNRALANTYLRTGLTYVAFYQVFYGFPMWLETGRALPPGHVGLVMLPIAVCAMVSVWLSGRVIRRLGHWPVLAVGSAGLLAGGLGLLGLHSASALPLVLLVAAVLGIPNGVNNIGNQTALYRQVEAGEMGTASGLYRTSQYVGANIAAAVIALSFTGPSSDAGLHRIGTVVACISVVLLAGAVLGMWRQRRRAAAQP